MATMNISLPDDMKEFVEAQAARRGFGTVSEYVRSLLRAVQEQEAARAEIATKLEEALNSGPSTPMTRADWADILLEVERRHESRQAKPHAPESPTHR